MNKSDRYALGTRTVRRVGYSAMQLEVHDNLRNLGLEAQGWLIYLARRGTLKSSSSQLQRVDAGLYPRFTGNVKKKGDFQESLDEYSACDKTRCGCLGAIGE